jgi:hypothetical protein
MQSEVTEPLNIGSSELVSINQLVDIAEDIGGVKLRRNYNLDAPKGVAGRNSDNTRIMQLLGWEPSIRLRDGMAKTYAWIFDEYMAKYGPNARKAVVSLNGRAKRPGKRRAPGRKPATKARSRRAASRR